MIRERVKIIYKGKNGIKNGSKNGDMLHLQKKTTGIMITNLCNSSCGGCHQFCGHFRPENIFHIDLNELRKNIEIIGEFCYVDHPWPESNFSGCHKAIQLFGGEPMLHPKFRDIMNILKNEYKHFNFIVRSNGKLEISRDLLSSNIKVVKDVKDSNRKFWPSLVAPIDILDVKDKVFYWSRAKMLCGQWLDIGCRSIIYKDRFYVCEPGAAFSNLCNLNIGWDTINGVSPYAGRNDKDIEKQMRELCFHCGFCLSRQPPDHHPVEMDELPGINQYTKDASFVTKTNAKFLFGKVNIIEREDKV